MNTFEQSQKDLLEFLSRSGKLDSAETHVTLFRVNQSLREALNPIPIYSGIPLYHCDVLGVQQYVIQFGCHLEYMREFSNSEDLYKIVPNWK